MTTHELAQQLQNLPNTPVIIEGWRNGPDFEPIAAMPNANPEYPAVILLRQIDRREQPTPPAWDSSPYVLLMEQIKAMMHRAETFRDEAKAEQAYSDAEKQARVHATLKELHRLGEYFAGRP